MNGYFYPHFTDEDVIKAQKDKQFAQEHIASKSLEMCLKTTVTWHLLYREVSTFSMVGFLGEATILSIMVKDVN